MNKTNYITLTLILCFSLIFVTCTLKFALADPFSDWAEAYIEAGEAVDHDLTDPDYNPPPLPESPSEEPSDEENGDTESPTTKPKPDSDDESDDNEGDYGGPGSWCDVTAVEDIDLYSFPDETWYIGMTFTGISETDYIAVAETNSQGGINLVWLPVGTESNDGNGDDGPGKPEPDNDNGNGNGTPSLPATPAEMEETGCPSGQVKPHNVCQ